MILLKKTQIKKDILDKIRRRQYRTMGMSPKDKFDITQKMPKLKIDLRPRRDPESIIVGFTNRNKNERVGYSGSLKRRNLDSGHILSPMNGNRNKKDNLNKDLSYFHSQSGKLQTISNVKQNENDMIKTTDTPKIIRKDLYEKSGFNNILKILMKIDNIKQPIFRARNRLRKRPKRILLTDFYTDILK